MKAMMKESLQEIQWSHLYDDSDDERVDTKGHTKGKAGKHDDSDDDARVGRKGYSKGKAGEYDDSDDDARVGRKGYSKGKAGKYDDSDDERVRRHPPPFSHPFPPLPPPPLPPPPGPPPPSPPPLAPPAGTKGKAAGKYGDSDEAAKAIYTRRAKLLASIYDGIDDDERVGNRQHKGYAKGKGYAKESATGSTQRLR